MVIVSMAISLQTDVTGDAVPSGVIVGYLSAAAPSGWVLMDGSNGTTDTRGYCLRGNPVGGTLGGTAGASTHTHSANHAHTGSIPNHCHCVASHAHTMACHSHTVNAHTHTLCHKHCIPDHKHRHDHVHLLANHVHSMGSHSHDLDSASALTLDYCEPHDHFIESSTANFSTCGGATEALTAVTVCPRSLSITIGGSTQSCALGNTGVCNKATGYNAIRDTDNCTGQKTEDPCVANTGSTSPGTDTKGATATGNCAPATDSIGLTPTIDSATVTTGGGSSLPPVLNVNWIMKL